MNSLFAGFDAKVGFLSNKGLINLSADRPQVYCNKVISKFYEDAKVVAVSSAGSGISQKEAEISSFYEGIERYTFMCPTRCYNSKIFDLSMGSTHPKLLPEEFNFFTNDQKNYSVIDKHIACKNNSRLWIQCENLKVDGNIDYFIPLGAVLDENKQSFFEKTTNGMAAGQNMDQAKYSALCEAIERDAFMYSWLTMEKLITFDFLKYIEDDYRLRILWQKLSLVRENIKIRLIPTVLGDYSVVASFQAQRNHKFPFFSMGMAYRPNLYDSIYKAMLELSQLLLSSQTQSKKSWNLVKDYGNKSKFFKDSSDIYACEESESLLGNFHHSVDSQNLPQPIHQQPANIVSILNMCSKKNIRIYCVDLTLPDVKKIGGVVCKVVSPDLIPLNLNNHLKPYGHKRFDHLETLNKFPHPFS